MIIPRRTLITGLAALMAAPAIVRAENIMRVKRVDVDMDNYDYHKLTFYNLFPFVDSHGSEVYSLTILPPVNPDYSCASSFSGVVSKQDGDWFLALPPAERRAALVVLQDRAVLRRVEG